MLRQMRLTKTEREREVGCGTEECMCVKFCVILDLLGNQCGRDPDPLFTLQADSGRISFKTLTTSGF